MSKYPKCLCGTKKFDYFRKRYKNGTLHLLRQCPTCGKVAMNPMKQEEYDRDWIQGLPIVENGVVVSVPTPPPPQPAPVKTPMADRVEAIQAKLENHIAKRNAKQTRSTNAG